MTTLRKVHLIPIVASVTGSTAVAQIRLGTGVFAARKEIGVNISELSSTFNSFYCISILVGLILFYPILHTAQKKVKYGDWLLLTYLEPAIMYIRTFIDIFLPMAFLTHSKTVLLLCEQGTHKVTECWKSFLNDIKNEIIERLPGYLFRKLKSKGSNRRRTFPLKPLIVGLFALVLFLGTKINLHQLKAVGETETLLSAIPKNSTILSSFNQQYRILFARPSPARS